LYVKKEILIEYYDKLEFIFKNITEIRKHLDTIFVFGGAHKDNSRDKFLHFIQKNNHTPFHFITIEELYKDIVKYSALNKGVSSKKIDLANLELEAIENAYSILLFPESPGSFAELGFFSAKNNTREKILVMNNLDFSHNESYVNELINLVHEDKQISPFHFSKNEEDKTFLTYTKTLMLRYESIDEYLRDIYEKDNIDNNKIYPLALIYEIIKLIPYMSFSDIKTLSLYIFKDKNIEIKNIVKYLTSMISLLVVSKIILRIEDNEKYVFKVIDNEYRILNYNSFDEKQQQILMSIEMEMRQAKEIKDEF
jgi:hypothetical protein